LGLRASYTGTMAALQIPASMLAERCGPVVVLVGGTILSGTCFLFAGASLGLASLLAALALGGLGASAQHHSAALALPAPPSCGVGAGQGQRPVAPGRGCRRPGGCGATCKRGPAAARFPIAPRHRQDRQCGSQRFLTFLPSLFKAKEASIASIGGALSLLFVGGAAGKLVCGYLGARIGLLNTVLLTEGLTAIGIIALLPLPLAGGLAVMPLLGIGLWHVLGALRHGARTGGRACGIFYPGAIAASAAMPALIGLIGDGFGVTTATTIVAVTVLATVPQSALLMPMLPAPARG